MKTGTSLARLLHVLLICGAVFGALVIGSAASAIGGPPTVTSVVPACGPAGAVTGVTIHGTNFLTANGVDFGGTAATNVVVVNDTTITANSPGRTASIVDVHVTTPLGTSVSNANDRFSYANPPTVTGLSRTRGPITGGTSVTIIGTGFFAGAQATFGGAAAATTFVDATHLSAVTPAHAAATVDVLVASCGGTSAVAAADKYQYVLPPTVDNLTPTTGPAAGGIDVVISGTGFWEGLTSSQVTQVKFGSSTATNLRVTSDSQMTVTLPAYTTSDPHTVNVIVTTTDGGPSANTSADDFVYTFPVPTVSSVSPAFGPTAGGTAVTVTGTGFTGAAASGAVNFGASPSTTYTVVSDTSITATSPSGTGTVDVTVTAPGGTSATATSGCPNGTPCDTFTYVVAPTVTSVTPAVGASSGGTDVVIAGTGFTGTGGRGPVTSVRFGALTVPANQFVVTNATSIHVLQTPAGAAGTVDVTVVSGGGTSATSTADHFTYVSAPSVTSVAPASGPTAGGTSVTITGTNFLGTGGTGPVSCPSGVMFGTTAATACTVNSATQITATSPAHTAGLVDVTVTNAGGTSATGNADHFTFVAPPTVTSVGPGRGPTAGGQVVTITGSSFQTSGTTQVTFGGVAATAVSATSAASITATTPAHAVGAVNVVVSNPDGQSYTLTNGYTYVAAPSVTLATPHSGPTAGGGTTVISGTGFWGGTASSDVSDLRFGTTAVAPASYVVDSDTQITVNQVPAHAAGAVDIRVSTAGGQSAAVTSGCPAAPCDRYTYIAALPTVTSVSPNYGPTAGGTGVTITGSGFTGTTSVHFGTADAPGFTVPDDQHITVNSPAAPGGNAATLDVTVTSDGGTSSATNADHFSYVTAPTITSIAPSNGPTAGGTSVTITGTGFQGTGGVGGVSGSNGVRFGQVTATSYTVDSATQITATSPAGSGTPHVRVVNGGGTSLPTAADVFTYNAPPVGGLVVDGYGGLHPYGNKAINTTGSSYWSGFDIARAVVVKPGGSGGYTLDGYGGVHAFGDATLISDNSHAYWSGWDIARGIAICGDGNRGYTLDGYGGVNAFGGAVPVLNSSHAYWQGWDIARGIVVTPDCHGGYTLDGYGGIHNFGTTPPIADNSHAYWQGWDIARGIVLRADGASGYTLDGYGGINAFGGAPAVANDTHAYWSGWDIANGIALGADGLSGYTLDGWGGVHNWAAPGGSLPPPVADNRPGAYWYNQDFARGISGA